MKYHHLVLLCCAFISIFCTRAAYSDVKVTISTHKHTNPEVIHFSAKRSVELFCNSSDNSGTITWEKNGKPVTEVSGLKDRIEIKSSSISLKNMEESDVGNYTCVVDVGGVKYTDVIALATASSSKWGVRVNRNTNVVEGEKMAVKCEVRGELTLQWWYKNTTSGENATLITGNEERLKVLSYVNDRNVNITNGEIRIDEVSMADRGEYTCIGESEDGQRFSMVSTVRVKDKYAALWPFIGICAEVFVLCAIIFIYEKKRNKTELEESDTDQSPDQKNTPDHGKESNLRHRQ